MQTPFPLEINTLRMVFKKRGSGWEGFISTPENLQGLLPRQTFPLYSSRSLLELSSEQPALGLVHMTRLPFRDAREKGPGRGPRPLFLSAE